MHITEVIPGKILMPFTMICRYVVCGRGLRMRISRTTLWLSHGYTRAAILGPGA